VGATIVDTHLVGRRSFARPMKKASDGHYIVLRVKMEPSKVDAVSARLRLNADVFRFQITSIDENAPLPSQAAVAAAAAAALTEPSHG
jgi:ribosomal protein S6